MTTVIYYVDINDKGKIMISQILFRKTAGKYWNKLNENISDLTKLTGTEEDKAPAQASILEMVRDFGALVRQVYGANAENDFDQAIQGMVAGLFEAIALIENEVDTAKLTTRVATNVIPKLSEKLASLNPDWTSSVTSPIFVGLWTAWLDQAKFALAKDIVEYDSACANAKSKGTTFADAFVNGVVAQYSPIFF